MKKEVPVSAYGLDGVQLRIMYAEVVDVVLGGRVKRCCGHCVFQPGYNVVAVWKLSFWVKYKTAGVGSIL